MAGAIEMRVEIDDDGRMKIRIHSDAGPLSPRQLGVMVGAMGGYLESYDRELMGNIEKADGPAALAAYTLARFHSQVGTAQSAYDNGFLLLKHDTPPSPEAQKRRKI